jgi:hypothetical protein
LLFQISFKASNVSRWKGEQRNPAWNNDFPGWKAAVGKTTRDYLISSSRRAIDLQSTATVPSSEKHGPSSLKKSVASECCQASGRFGGLKGVQKASIENPAGGWHRRAKENLSNSPRLMQYLRELPAAIAFYLPMSAMHRSQSRRLAALIVTDELCYGEHTNTCSRINW